MIPWEDGVVMAPVKKWYGLAASPVGAHGKRYGIIRRWVAAARHVLRGGKCLMAVCVWFLHAIHSYPDKTLHKFEISIQSTTTRCCGDVWWWARCIRAKVIRRALRTRFHSIRTNRVGERLTGGRGRGRGEEREGEKVGRKLPLFLQQTWIFIWKGFNSVFRYWILRCPVVVTVCYLSGCMQWLACTSLVGPRRTCIDIISI